MTKEFGARVIVELKEDFAKAVNKDGLQYSKAPELLLLKIMLEEKKATLTNVMRDFEYYVQSSDAHGAEESPMIAWTRAATKLPAAHLYYGQKFVVTLGAGTKVMPMDEAEKLKERLSILNGLGAVKNVRVDSMDPKKNPPIPAKYFK